MKTLLRNKQPFYYANLLSQQPAYDKHGNETSELVTTYSAPVKVYANISAARGNAELDEFGLNTNYSKTIVTEELSLPIDKSTILWIGIEPDLNGEAGTVKHNYCVVAVAKSLNSMTIAVAEVNVS